MLAEDKADPHYSLRECAIDTAHTDKNQSFS